jgi:hypothetical protein
VISVAIPILHMKYTDSYVREHNQQHKLTKDRSKPVVLLAVPLLHKSVDSGSTNQTAACAVGVLKATMSCRHINPAPLLPAHETLTYNCKAHDTIDTGRLQTNLCKCVYNRHLVDPTIFIYIPCWMRPTPHLSTAARALSRMYSTVGS